MHSALALLICLQLPGQVDLDPRLRWYTLETDHFAVHFPLRGPASGDSLALARAVANICEEVHALLMPVMRWAPRERTDVVIADFYDYTNGWATPFPRNTITLLPCPPAGERTNDDDWLRTLTIHEYTHVLQTDMARGLPLSLRRVFGRAALPNAVAPAWLNEGYAVFNETRFTSFGRIRSARYRALLSSAQDSRQLLSLDQCGTYELQGWPGGEAPYLYGSMLHSFVAARDSGFWDSYNLTRAGSVPFLENYNARRAGGRSISALWAEWRQSLVPDTQGSWPALAKLTHDGAWSGSPVWNSDGSEVYYVARSGREYPAIKAVAVAGRAPGSDTVTTPAPRTLVRARVNGGLSLSRDGRRLAFGMLERTDHADHSDIWVLDLSTGRLRRVTSGLRARDPDFTPDGTGLTCIATRSGRNELVMVNIDTRVQRVIAEAGDRATFHSPRFSPSGGWIAVGVNRPGGYADIELVDCRSDWVIPVTHDRANDINPCWSRTGRYLFFASDRSGTFDIYAHELATGRQYRCTRSRYGVHEPAVSPDNRRFAVTATGPEGDDVALLDLRGTDWIPAEPYADTLPEPSRPDSAVAATLYYYSPFPSLWPSFWLPWLGHSGLGALIFGWDPLRAHTYSAVAGWSFPARSPALSLAYSCRGLGPLLAAAADFDTARLLVAASAGLTLRRRTWNAWFDAGPSLRAAWRGMSGLRFSASATCSDAHEYRFCVAPVEGQVGGLWLDARSNRVLSDRDLLRPLGFYVRYFGNPPATWSLRCHLSAATAFGDSSVLTAWELGEQGTTGVRGYGAASAPGRSRYTAGAQFRRPLWWIERGLGTGPLFLSNLNGAAFLDLGLCATGLGPTAGELQRTRIGIGAELRLDLVAFHLLPARLTAGAGIGLNPAASLQCYLGLQSDMLTGLLTRTDPDAQLRAALSRLAP